VTINDKNPNSNIDENLVLVHKLLLWLLYEVHQRFFLNFSNVNDQEYLNSFDILERLLISELFLKFDAVLSQEGYPICYAIRTLNDQE